MFVPVVDRNQHPLMPTTPARARRWVKSGKATPFWKQGVFCVRLNVDPSAREVQPVAVGIDPGSHKEGYSVVSAAHTYLNIQVDAVDWVKDAVKQRRQLHRLEAAKGGKRTPYGGTLSLGLKRGTLVRHAKYGLTYVGGTMGGKLSLHAPHSGKRLTQGAKLADCHRIKLLRWRARLLPVP